MFQESPGDVSGQVPFPPALYDDDCFQMIGLLLHSFQYIFLSESTIQTFGEIPYLPKYSYLLRIS